MPRKKNSETVAPTTEPSWARPGGIAPDDPYAPESVAVYRAFNVAGALLYVGVSDHPKRRFQQHATDKYWWRQDVSRWEVAWFPDREAALAEEARAIHDETPAYNIAGIPEPIDKAANRDAFLVAIAMGDMPLQVLNSFFLGMVKRKSLPRQPEPRTKLGARDTEEIYLQARERASRWTLRRHQRFIERWNEQQEHDWFAFAPPEQRPSA